MGLQTSHILKTDSNTLDLTLRESSQQKSSSDMIWYLEWSGTFA